MTRLKTTEWQRLREIVLNDSPLCRICHEKGLTVAADHVDHIVPLSLGGNNDIKNLQPICRECHFDKTARENAFQLPINEDGYPDKISVKALLRRRKQFHLSHKFKHRRKRPTKKPTYHIPPPI